MKSGFISLVGRPNSGKSTLLNNIIGKKVAITSNKPQTTRNQIKGIYHEKDYQMIFVDTPGIHKATHKLGTYLNRYTYDSVQDVDLHLFVVDGSVSFGKGDEFVFEKIKKTNKPIILVLNKIDKLTKEEIFYKIKNLSEKYEFDEIVPISALKSQNIKELIQVIKKFLTDDIPYYEKDTYTDQSLSFQISEIVREKIFELTDQEIPHSITCITENIEKKKNSYYLQVCVIVDRDSIKKIIIGKQGKMIKEIGVKARDDLEQLLGKKVYLETYVKVIKKWRDKEKYLQEFGYSSFE